MADPRKAEDGDGAPAGLDVVGLVRQARRRADTSQREMAEAAGVAASTLGRIEAGSLRPSLAVLEAILGVARIRLVAVGPDGKAVQAMLDAPDHNLRDGAGRRYPSHLDVIVDPTGSEWWGGRYGLAEPPETFVRDRTQRDVQRARSVAEVRVALHRADPLPPTLEQWRRLRRRQAEREIRMLVLRSLRRPTEVVGGRRGPASPDNADGRR